MMNYDYDEVVESLRDDDVMIISKVCVMDFELLMCKWCDDVPTTAPTTEDGDMCVRGDSDRYKWPSFITVVWNLLIACRIVIKNH